MYVQCSASHLLLGLHYTLTAKFSQIMEPAEREQLNPMQVFMGELGDQVVGTEERLPELTSAVQCLLADHQTFAGIKETRIHLWSRFLLWPPWASLPNPDKYTGKPESCGSFLVQCDFAFRAQPSRFASEQSKIHFAISLLTGCALMWTTAVWERQSPICDTFSTFTDELRRVFDHPVSGQESLHALRQGRGTGLGNVDSGQLVWAQPSWLHPPFNQLQPPMRSFSLLHPHSPCPWGAHADWRYTAQWAGEAEMHERGMLLILQSLRHLHTTCLKLLKKETLQ